jgi:hypothetical protein
MPVMLATWEAENRRIKVGGHLGEIRKAGGVSQEVEHLLCKHEAPSPNPKRRKKKKNPMRSQAPVAHTCNPSYSGGRDQEDHGSR